MLNVRTMKNRIHGNRHAVMTESGVMYVPNNIYHNLVNRGDVANDELVKKDRENKTKAGAAISARQFCR